MINSKKILLGLALLFVANVGNSQVPKDFVEKYYAAYSGTPTSAKLAPFYHDSVWLEDPTFDFVGKNKAEIFRNFDNANLLNHYEWQVAQTIISGDTVVTEGNLVAKYGGIPYNMRFVNIFHLKDGLVFRQYDYYDTRLYHQAVKEWKEKNPKK
jgi:ketosteroid isomerase-like protein